MTVGSALRMRPGLGWIFAFSAVFSLGANSRSSFLSKQGEKYSREKEERWRISGGGNIEDSHHLQKTNATFYLVANEEV